MAYQGKLVTVQDVSGQVANGTGATCVSYPRTLSEACGSVLSARRMQSKLRAQCVAAGFAITTAPVPDLGAQAGERTSGGAAGSLQC